MKDIQNTESKSKSQLIMKIAQLESINDQLFTELTVLNNLLRTVGFENGIATAKEAAAELLDQMG